MLKFFDAVMLFRFMIATTAATTNTTIIYFEGASLPSESVSRSVVSDSLPSYGLYAQKQVAYTINL